MTLSGYFDESGTDKGNPFIVVAGFFSDEDQWSRFEREWSSALERFGVPYFKAKQFDDGRRGWGFYKDWPDARRWEYLDLLLGIIKRRTFKSFSTSLDKSAYDAIVAPDGDLERYFHSPYVFCAINCIHAAVEWRDELHPGEPLVFTFDEGHKNQGQLLEVASRVIVGDDRLIHGVGVGDDRKLIELQAADLLAFELCSEKRKATNQATKWSRHPLLVLDEQAHDWLAIGTENIRGKIQDLLDKGSLEIRQDEG